MDRTKWPAISGLVVGTALLTRSIPTTFALDKPIHTSIVLLASSAAAIIVLSRLLPRDGGRSHNGQEYHALSLEDVGRSHNSREPSPTPDDVRYPSSLRKLRILFMILVSAICARVGIWQHVLGNTQCAGFSWEPLIPLALALINYRTMQKPANRAAHDDLDTSVYDALEARLLGSPHRYSLAAGLLSLGGLLAIGVTTSPESTYICAASLHYRWTIPVLQHLGTVLDLLITYCIGQLLHQQEGRGTRSVSLRFISVGWAMAFSAVSLLGVGFIYYITTGEDRNWMLTIPTMYFWSVLRLDALVCFAAICIVITVS